MQNVRRLFYYENAFLFFCSPKLLCTLKAADRSRSGILPHNRLSIWQEIDGEKNNNFEIYINFFISTAGDLVVMALKSSVSSAVLPVLSLHISCVKGQRALLNSGIPSKESYIYICLMFVGTSTKKGTKSKIKEISLSIIKQSKVESFRVKSMNLKKRTDGLKKKVKSVKSHLQWYQQERTDGRATTFTSYCA